jgi:hypothetical protein
VAAAPAHLSTADRALLQAHAVWGRPADARFWNRFEADWSERLRTARETAGDREADPATISALLQAEHAAEARPDLARVHPSWWVRGLQDESPAVRRAVAEHAREEVSEVLREGLSLTAYDLATDHRPHPEALRWALTLWTERLVGGPETRADDPPVIVALSHLELTTFMRLVVVTGLAKLAYALATSETDVATVGLDDLELRDRERVAHFRSVWEPFERRLVHLARLDLSGVKVGGAKRFERLGLITVGRLLADAEPQRVRWALQHLPYHVAKHTRAHVSLANSQVAGARLLAWEGRVFEVARDRLRDEGHLRQAEGDVP